MTDNEIINALECCRTNIMGDCKRCNLRLEDGTTQPFCTTILMGNALDLINRQKAEIERLRDEIRQTHATIPDLIKQVRTKAIQEFAERLKPILFNYYDSEIDNLVKEMVGDGNA